MIVKRRRNLANKKVTTCKINFNSHLSIETIKGTRQDYLLLSPGSLFSLSLLLVNNRIRIGPFSSTQVTTRSIFCSSAIINEQRARTISIHLSQMSKGRC